jgi:putative transposase
MARPPRLTIPGVALHVIQRGVNRTACFFSDIDRRYYLKCLAKYAGRRQCTVHAYVLMSNHVHLLLTPQREGSVAKMLQDLGRTYVRTINSLHGRSGTLWDGRFKSSLVDSETYLMNCHRYVELNPVRAGIVGRAADYPWSSYAHYALGRENPVITEHPSYLELGGDSTSRSKAFCALFDEQMDETLVQAIRDATNTGSALGSKAFLARTASLVGREVQIPQRGRPRKDSGSGIINKLL